MYRHQKTSGKWTLTNWPQVFAWHEYEPASAEFDEEGLNVGHRFPELGCAPLPLVTVLGGARACNLERSKHRTSQSSLLELSTVSVFGFPTCTVKTSVKMGGSCCAAIGCNSSARKSKGISFHQFPQDPTMRLKWITAMKREGFQPTQYSLVCSVHFHPEDFEQVTGKTLKRNYLKRSAVRSIFSFSDKTTLMQALEKKPEPKQKRKNPGVVKVAPACLGDSHPCCEREHWENLPIVSKMCNTCVKSCREEYNPEDHEEIDTLNNSVIGNQKKQQLISWKDEEISQEAMIKYDSKTQDYQCKSCPDPPYKSNQKINLWTHIRSVHLRDRQFRCILCSFSASQKIGARLLVLYW